MQLAGRSIFEKAKNRPFLSKSKIPRQDCVFLSIDTFLDRFFVSSISFFWFPSSSSFLFFSVPLLVSSLFPSKTEKQAETHTHLSITFWDFRKRALFDPASQVARIFCEKRRKENASAKVSESWKRVIHQATSYSTTVFLPTQVDIVFSSQANVLFILIARNQIFWYIRSIRYEKVRKADLYTDGAE